MKKILTIFLLLCIFLVINGTDPGDSTKVVVNKDFIERYNSYEGNVFVSYKGFVKITETVLPSDSLYLGKYVYSYNLDSTTVYVNY